MENPRSNREIAEHAPNESQLSSRDLSTVQLLRSESKIVEHLQGILYEDPGMPTLVSSPTNPMTQSELGSARFVPELIETTRRCRKNRNLTVSLQAIDRKQKNSATSALDDFSSKTPESKFSASSLSRKPPRHSSFKVPHLESIQSQPGSDESKCPSLSTSPSEASDESPVFNCTSRLRESCDDSFAGYLLALAARAAAKHLQDQALAAYPNGASHEPVEHFAIDLELATSEEQHALVLGSKDYNEAGIPRLETNTGWDVAELRVHKDIRPPMLGTHLKFPQSLSPQQTRFDVTQHPSTTGEPKLLRSHAGLWKQCGAPSRISSSKGLWNGICGIDSGDNIHSIPRAPQSGLITPNIEQDDPLETSVVCEDLSPLHLPSKSYTARTHLAFLDDEGLLDDFEDDLDGAFVTQIYNYLSLGHPTLARRFDHELAKISHIPIDKIRADDTKRDGREFFFVPGENRNGRWLSLRLYIREWDRQHTRISRGDAENRVVTTSPEAGITNSYSMK